MGFDLSRLTSNAKYPPEWIALRREIQEWTTTHKLPYSEVPSLSSYRDFKVAVYVPIKLALGLDSIDQIQTSQIPKARKIFYKIRDICEGVDPDEN